MDIHQERHHHCGNLFGGYFFPSLAFDCSFFTINVTTAILEGHNFISSYDFSTKTVKFNMHKICIEVL
jgi:hypothetical protein